MTHKNYLSDAQKGMLIVWFNESKQQEFCTWTSLISTIRGDTGIVTTKWNLRSLRDNFGLKFSVKSEHPRSKHNNVSSVSREDFMIVVRCVIELATVLEILPDEDMDRLQSIDQEQEDEQE